MSKNRIAIALRPKVIAADEIVKLAKLADQSNVSNIFIPDLPFGYDSLELSAACLGVSSELFVGSGVMRPLEHNEKQLLRRLETLQALSANRFTLGIGTGDPGPDPKKTVEAMLAMLRRLKQGFSEPRNFPRTFIATLRKGIARKVASDCDGILLNFCSAGYAGSVVNAVKESSSKPIEFACYLKVFYSASESDAKRAMIEEFARYNSIPHYSKMFAQNGILGDIVRAKAGLATNSPETTHGLLEVCPVNPSIGELGAHVEKFRNQGISLPAVYPYFGPNDDYEYKAKTVKEIITATG